jgi:hypothetical protein
VRRLERQAPGVDPRDREDVVDEPEQPVGVPAHDLEEAHLLLGQVSRLAVEHQLEVADDRRDRRSQLVRDRADELVLHPVELEQLLVLLRERLRHLSLALQQLLALHGERELGGDRVEEMRGGELRASMSTTSSATTSPRTGIGARNAWPFSRSSPGATTRASRPSASVLAVRSACS